MFTATTHHGIYVTDQDEALDFYVGKLGLQVSADIDLGMMRWLTVQVPGDERHILLELAGPPSVDDATAEQVRDVLSKGGMGLGLILTTDDAHATYAQLRDAGVEVSEEPVERPYGIDFGLRDPFGNGIRITQPIAATQEEIQAGFDAERA